MFSSLFARCLDSNYIKNTRPVFKVQGSAKELSPCLKIPGAARQLGQPMHGQSANFGKFKLHSLNLAPFLLFNSAAHSFGLARLTVQ